MGEHSCREMECCIQDMHKTLLTHELRLKTLAHPTKHFCDRNTLCIGKNLGNPQFFNSLYTLKNQNACPTIIIVLASANRWQCDQFELSLMCRPEVMQGACLMGTCRQLPYKVMAVTSTQKPCGEEDAFHC